MASQVNGYIGKLNPGNGTQYSLGSTAYGECSTAAGTAAKTVEMTGFTLMKGATIFVKFTNTNSATNPTLSVNSTTAKPLVKYGSSTINWSAGAVLCLTYDGTSWIGTSVTLQDLGLSNAMHFIGKATVAVSDTGTEDPTITGYDFTNDRKPGDVIIGKDDGREYVWTIAGQWELLGQNASTTVDSGAPTTNTWVSRVQQNSDRTITVTTGTLDTSGTWSGKLSKTFKVKLNNTQYTYDGSANVDLSTIYAPTAGGTANTQALVGNGTTTTPKWVNINPTSAWTAGGNNGADGPSLKITVLGQTQSTGAVIPSAGAGASGVVTTGNQQFDGNKTFKGNILPQANNTYDLGTSSLTWKNLYVRNIIFDSADSSTEANRIVWTDSNKKLVANNHYADATHIAINTETAQNENFYVNGSSQFNLGNTDTVQSKWFLINGNSRQLSIGAAEIQTYSSNQPSQLYLNFIGDNTSNPPGNVSIGNAYGGSLGLYNTTLTSGTGISLSSGPENGIPKTGIAYASISTYGFYGGVDGNQNAATYLTVSTINHDGADIGQNTNAHSGWIFKNVNKTTNAHLTEGNIASIGVNGYFYGKGFAVYNDAGTVRYGYMYLNAEGVEDQDATNGVTAGDIRLVLGNNRSVTAETLSDKIDNARGTIYLYGTEDSFTRIRHGEWYGSNLVVPINNIISGRWTADTDADEARRIDVRSGAGVIYAQSDATTAGNRGIYLTSADGTSNYGITFNQSNQVNQIANFNTNIVFTNNANGYGVTRSGINSSWNNSQARALLRISSINGGLAALWSLKSTNGYWIGAHYDDRATTNPSYQNHYLVGFLHDNNVSGLTGALNRYTFSAELIPPSITPTNSVDRNAFVTVDYNGTTAAKGTATKPVYIDNNSVVQEATYELKATVNNGRVRALAYYDTTTSISETAKFTIGGYLQTLTINGDSTNVAGYYIANTDKQISLQISNTGNEGIYQSSSATDTAGWLIRWTPGTTSNKRTYMPNGGLNITFPEGANNYASPGLLVTTATAIGSSQYTHIIQGMASGLNAGGGAVISVGKEVSAYNAGSLIFNYVADQSSANYLSLGFVNHQHLFKFYGDGKMQIPFTASGYSSANNTYSLRLGEDTTDHLDFGYDGMQSQLANNGGTRVLYLNYAGGNVIAGSNSAGGSLCVRNTSNTTGAGISLYGNGPATGDLPTYGEALAGTATFGTYAGVNSSWAHYFTTSASGTGRGWIFKAYDSANKTSGNVASIRAADGILFNGGVSLHHPNIPEQWCGDFYVNTVGTTTTEGKVYLRVGNNVAAGTNGNEKGQLVLYGSGVNYTAITTNATANTAVTFPATVSGQVPLVILPVRTTFTDGGTWTLANFNIRSQPTPATSDYYLPMMNQNGATYLSDVLRTSVRIYNGTTEGYAGLVLGNNIPTGTAGAAHGYFYLYTTGTGYVGINGAEGALDGTNTVAYLNVNSNLKATKVWGSVYNDYAEFRKMETAVEPGRCVKEIGDDSLEITVKRLERGCEIVSDTYGFAIGATESAKTPIASSGRVLAYPYEPREEFASHIGWPVCSGPNGTVSIMTEEEEEKYPSRIIGTISAVPDYEEWGEDNIKVNGRVWIRIR